MNQTRIPGFLSSAPRLAPTEGRTWGTRIQLRLIEESRPALSADSWSHSSGQRCIL